MYYKIAKMSKDRISLSRTFRVVIYIVLLICSASVNISGGIMACIDVVECNAEIKDVTSAPRLAISAEETEENKSFILSQKLFFCFKISFRESCFTISETFFAKAYSIIYSPLRPSAGVHITLF